MNKELSNKITNINFILIIMIVILHASFENEMNITHFSYNYVNDFYKIIGTLADSAVPTFFCISGFLLFRNYNKETMGKKIISRIYSLVIPYFLWSIIFIGYYYLISKLNFIDYKEYDFSIKSNFVKYFWLASCAQTMWFVRVLVIYTILSPIMYILFYKLKNKISIIILLLFFVNLLYDFSYSTFIFWLPIYLLGGYLGFLDYDLMKIKFTKNKKITVTIFILLVYGIHFFDASSKIYYFYRMIAPIFIWTIYDIFNFKLDFKLKKDSFFIFCVHIPIIQIVRKIIGKILGTNPIISLIGYIMTILLTLMIIYMLTILLKKYCSKIYNVLIGGRI